MNGRILGWALTVLLVLLTLVACQSTKPGCPGFAPVPTDLDTALSSLAAWLQPADLEDFKQTAEDDLAGKYHFGLGLTIRNCWGLWAGSRLATYFNRIGIEHPDDMSGIVLTSLWRRLNGRPIHLEEQVKAYQAYWRKTHEQPGGA